MSNYKIDYFIIAENVAPGENNKQTIVNTFDEVYAPKLPTSQQLLSLAIKVKAPNGIKKGSKLQPGLTVLDPTGKEMGTFSIDPVEIDSSSFTGLTLGIGAHGMPLEHYGEYTFQFLIDGEHIGSQTLTVKGER